MNLRMSRRGGAGESSAKSRPCPERRHSCGAAVLCAAVFCCVCMGLASCGGEKKSSLPDDVLIAVGDSVLTLHEVVSRIPVGLEPSDSVNLFNKIVDTWIQNLLLREVAEENLTDLSRIEAMVDEYRNQLIVSEYRRRIKEENVQAVPDDSIREYYRKFGDDMMLEQPLVKGIYLKISSKAENLEEVIRRMRSGKPEDIDFIEKNAMRDAMQYDYFGDRWVDWQIIAEQIPYRFSDPNGFVNNNKFFSTEYNGATYLLHISDHIDSGEKMPYDFAAPLIADRLNERQRSRYEERLVNSLYRKALRDGKLKKVSFDPVTHQRIIPRPEEI